MQQNVNPCYLGNSQYTPAMQAPNAVNINIYQPQAYGSGSDCAQNQGYCSLYGANQNMPIYPLNYNNLINYPNAQQGYGYPLNQNPYNQGINQYPPYYAQNPIVPQDNGLNNGANALGAVNLLEKTPSKEAEKTEKSDKTDKKDDKKKKEKTILTDEYIKSLENYLNDNNPKVRLIAAKELMERFKEDDTRIAHPSLVPLLNKILKDTSPSVRFLALTTLQLGYSVGDKETIEILKELQSANKDKMGEDALLASEILLKLSAPKVMEVK